MARHRAILLEHVAVGTALTGGPPHGSGRAELPHPALALGNNAKAHQRMRMITMLTPFTSGCLTYPLSALDMCFRLCVRGMLRSSIFPLASPLSSTASSAAQAALFGSLVSTMGLCDFPGPCIIGVRP